MKPLAARFEEQRILQGISPIATFQNSGFWPAKAKSVSARRLAIAQLFRPGALSVVVMILVVGGWSYGLRLSHYLHLENPDVTKASTTRLWLDQRDQQVTAPVQHHEPAHGLINPILCGFDIPRVPHFSSEEVLAPSVQSHTETFVSPLHPLRAPPTPNFLRA